MGRPATGKTQLQITLKLDKDVVQILNDAKIFGYKNRNGLINRCIRYWNIEVLEPIINSQIKINYEK